MLNGCNTDLLTLDVALFPCNLVNSYFAYFELFLSRTDELVLYNLPVGKLKLFKLFVLHSTHLLLTKIRLSFQAVLLNNFFSHCGPI